MSNDIQICNEYLREIDYETWRKLIEHVRERCKEDMEFYKKIASELEQKFIETNKTIRKLKLNLFYLIFKREIIKMLEKEKKRLEEELEHTYNKYKSSKNCYIENSKIIEFVEKGKESYRFFITSEGQPAVMYSPEMLRGNKPPYHI